MTTSLAILGGGGHGRVVADCAERLGWSEIDLFDDGSPAPGPWPIAGTGQSLLERPAAFDAVIVGLGCNALRLALTKRLADGGGCVTRLIHPNAIVSSHASIGEGSVVFAGAVVNVGARIGLAAIINTGATVDHDCLLEDGVHVSPGAHLAGGVTVGESSWIGIGAVVREGISIGRGAVVGAGAVVIRAVADGATVVGNPQRILRG